MILSIENSPYFIGYFAVEHQEEFPDLSIGPRKGREKLIVFSKT